MSIKRRGGQEDGNYFYRFTYKKRDFCEGGFRTMAQAVEAERIAKNLAIANKINPENQAEDMTMRAAGQWWLDNWAPKKRSRKLDFSRMPVIMAYFDKTPISATSPTDIDEFLSKLSKLTGYHVGDHTRNHYRALIHALYERLKNKRLYSGENPASFVEKIEVPVARCRFIYPAEEKILTPAMAQNADLYSYYRLGVDTGMRIGEMRAIRVQHVDMTMKHIFIPHPKNNRSRYVPFEASLEGLLASLMTGKGPDDYLLPHWGHTYLLKHFHIICGAIGIKNLTIHDWRHTFAYNLLSQGKSIYKVSLLMGHSAIDVTQKHYGHLAQKDLRDEIGSVRPFLSCNRIATAESIMEEKSKQI